MFSSKWVYFDALSFSSLFKIFAFFSSCAKAVNFAGMTRPTSVFLFPVTVAVRRLSAFACKKKVNKCISSIGHGQQEYFQHLGIHVSCTRRLRWCCILWLRPFYLLCSVTLCWFRVSMTVYTHGVLWWLSRKILSNTSCIELGRLLPFLRCFWEVNIILLSAQIWHCSAEAPERP